MRAAWTFILQPASLGALGGLGASAMTSVVPDWWDARKMRRMGLPGPHKAPTHHLLGHGMHGARTSGVEAIVGGMDDIVGGVNPGGVYDLAGNGGVDPGGVYDIAGGVDPGGVYDVAGGSISDIVGGVIPGIVGGEYDIIGQSADVVGAWWRDFWEHHVRTSKSSRYAKRIAEFLHRGDMRAHRAIVILNQRIVNEGDVIAQETVDRLRGIFRRKVRPQAA
jgi:hypothetical protein